MTNSFSDPSTTSLLSSWFYLVYMIWYYYLSVKFVRRIVKQKIENKLNLFLKNSSILTYILYFVCLSWRLTCAVWYTIHLHRAPFQLLHNTCLQLSFCFCPYTFPFNKCSSNCTQASDLYLLSSKQVWSFSYLSRLFLRSIFQRIYPYNTFLVGISLTQISLHWRHHSSAFFLLSLFPP